MMNWVSKHLRKMARGERCLINSPMCNHNRDTVVLCHGRKGKGMGLKACDSDTVFGCSGCNHYTDQSGVPREEIDLCWIDAKARMALLMIEINGSVTGWKQKHKEAALGWLERNRGVAVFDYELARMKARVEGGSVQIPEWVKSADDF